MIITGGSGCVQIGRAAGESIRSEVKPSDVNTVVKRFGFAGDESNILTGDRVEITTGDPRGLAFIPPDWWADNVVHNSATFYAHVNAMGGLRLYRTFADALNNDRDKAAHLLDFSGDPIQITAELKDTGTRPLGAVSSYTFNTDREAVDVTTLGELFSEQYSAGTITGSGTIDCYFQVKGGMCAVAGGGETEVSMILPQMLLRADMGAEIDLILTVATPTPEAPIYYEMRAVITRAGVTVSPTSLIELAVDFVTTGEFALRVGEGSEYILMEDYDRMMREQDVDYLLTEPAD